MPDFCCPATDPRYQLCSDPLTAVIGVHIHFSEVRAPRFEHFDMRKPDRCVTGECDPQAPFLLSTMKCSLVCHFIEHRRRRMAGEQSRCSQLDGRNQGHVDRTSANYAVCAIHGSVGEPGRGCGSQIALLSTMR